MMLIVRLKNSLSNPDNPSSHFLKLYWRGRKRPLCRRLAPTTAFFMIGGITIDKI